MTDEQIISILKNRYGKIKKGNGDWIQIPCPTCTPKDARKMKRGVNLKSFATNCFICQQKIYLKDLIGDVKFQRAVESIKQIRDESEHPQARIIPATGVIPINQLPKEHPAIKFMQKDYLYEFDRYWEENYIGYITPEAAIDIVYEKEDSDDVRISPADSLVFPVYFKGELVGWQLRYIPGTPNGDRKIAGKIKYLHIFKKGNYLYNHDVVKNYEMVVVTEGVKKALKFPNGVATFGKGISDIQIQKLLRWKKIVFMYDGEDNTQEKSAQLAEELNIGDRRCINIDPRKYGFSSPDEMPAEEAQRIVYKEWVTKFGYD